MNLKPKIKLNGSHQYTNGSTQTVKQSQQAFHSDTQGLDIPKSTVHKSNGKTFPAEDAAKFITQQRL